MIFAIRGVGCDSVVAQNDGDSLIRLRALHRLAKHSGKSRFRTAVRSQAHFGYAPREGPVSRISAPQSQIDAISCHKTQTRDCRPSLSSPALPFSLRVLGDSIETLRPEAAECNNISEGGAYTRIRGATLRQFGGNSWMGSPGEVVTGQPEGFRHPLRSQRAIPALFHHLSLGPAPPCGCGGRRPSPALRSGGTWPRPRLLPARPW
jgi:hypothetical protein